MAQTHRLKKTRQIVHVVGKEDSNHTIVMIQLDVPTRAGNRGILMSVRNENLIDINDI
jgi:hypothetical protein